MSEQRKFYRRTMTVVVLSEDPIPEMKPEAVLEAIDTGDCVGTVTFGEEEVLCESEMVDALYAAGSEPAFFSIEEDEDENMKALEFKSLSHLLRTAIGDCRELMKQGVRLSMPLWRMQSSEGICAVCLAGAVMTRTLELGPGQPIDDMMCGAPTMAPDTRSQLFALNYLRLGHLPLAISTVEHLFTDAQKEVLVGKTDPPNGSKDTENDRLSNWPRGLVEAVQQAHTANFNNLEVYHPEDFLKVHDRLADELEKMGL